MAQPNVLYIAGHARGGSTLLAFLLNQLPGYCAVGEINLIWKRGFIDNELCTCGKPFHKCEFWDAVVKQAYGNWENVEAEHWDMLRKQLNGLRNIPRQWFPQFVSARYGEKLRTMSDVLAKLYSAMQMVSDCDVLVDHSKWGVYGAILNQDVKGVKVNMVHLNRHPSAVAYSRLRKKQRAEIHWKDEYMLQTGVLHTIYSWNMKNLACELTKRLCESHYHIKYEDVAKYPVESVSRIMRHFGEIAINIPQYISDTTIQVQDCHMFGGNPVRFQGNELSIRYDEKWRTEMPFYKKASIAVLSLPAMLYYRYF